MWEFKLTLMTFSMLILSLISEHDEKFINVVFFKDLVKKGLSIFLLIYINDSDKWIFFMLIFPPWEFSFSFSQNYRIFNLKT